MKITYTDLQNIAQEVIGLTDAATLTKIKRDINVGATKMLAALGREYNRKSRFTDLVAAQQYYQFSEDVHKLKEIVANSGGWNTPLEQISDEHTWRAMIATGTTGQPTHYYIRGYDEVGLYPIPSATITAGLELVFSPTHVQLFQDDYSTGTLTATNGSQTITGSGTTFNANMVGSYLQVTDGSDGNWYKISTFTSTTVLVLENFYQGSSASSLTYRIGQVVDFPEEYLEAPSDYACYRHYLRRGDRDKTATFKAIFDTAIQEAQEEYGEVTDNAVIYAEPTTRFYNPYRGDPPPGGISA